MLTNTLLEVFKGIPWYVWLVVAIAIAAKVLFPIFKPQIKGWSGIIC